MTMCWQRGAAVILALITLVVYVPAVVEAKDKPVCLFFHGFGQDGPGFRDQNCRFTPSGNTIPGCALGDKEMVVAKMKRYWGKLVKKVHKHKKCKPVFHWAATNHNTWSSETLTADYCKAIEDTNANIIFSHSMGNVIIAAGIRYGHAGCKRILPRSATGPIPRDKTVWFGSQGPLRGTPSGGMCAKLCALPVPKTPDVVYSGGAQKCGCGKDSKYVGKGYPGARSLSPDYVNPRWEYNDKGDERVSLQFRQSQCAKVAEVEARRKTKATGSASGNWRAPTKVDYSKPLKCVTVDSVADEYMWGNICGITPHPLSGLRPQMYIAGAVVNKYYPWGDDRRTVATLDSAKLAGNDGVVPFKGCAGLRIVDFKWTADSRFYVLAGNHEDGCARNGDSRSRTSLKLKKPKEAPEDCDKGSLKALDSLDAPYSELADESKSDEYVKLDDEEIAASDFSEFQKFTSSNKVDLRPGRWYRNMIDLVVKQLAPKTDAVPLPANTKPTADVDQVALDSSDSVNLYFKSSDSEEDASPKLVLLDDMEDEDDLSGGKQCSTKKPLGEWVEKKPDPKRSASRKKEDQAMLLPKSVKVDVTTAAEELFDAELL